MANNPVLLDNKAYKKYEYLANINDPLQIAKLLLFHIFVFRQTFLRLWFTNENELMQIHYRETLKKVFIKNPFITDIDLLRKELKEQAEVLIRRGFYSVHECPSTFENLLKYNWNKFLSIYGNHNEVSNNHIYEDIRQENPRTYTNWVPYKFPSIDKQKTFKHTIEIDFREPMNIILEKVKKIVESHKPKINNNFTAKQLMSIKNKKILELLFVYIKYADKSQLTYPTIYEELNMVYHKNKEHKITDATIRKNRMRLLKQLLDETSIYNLQAYIQKEAVKSAQN